MITVQLTSTSVSTKGEKQAGTTQLSKYFVYTRCAQSLYRLYPKVEMMKTKCPKLKIWFRQPIYTILTIEICYNRQIHEK